MESQNEKSRATSLDKRKRKELKIEQAKNQAEL